MMRLTGRHQTTARAGLHVKCLADTVRLGVHLPPMLQPQRDLLIVMARYPTPGKVKTRLARDIGQRAAADLYRSFLETFVRAFSRTTYDVEWHFTPARAPFRRWLRTARWPAPETCRPQPAGDLGTRMQAIFDDAFRRGYRRVIMIGTDAPEVNNKVVTSALKQLRRSTAVFQPTHDGGYALIGLNRMIDLFTKIPWSTDRVMRTTIDRVEALGIRYKLLPATYDIDTERDVVDYLSK
jgi:rSAM/selenodomain-associated transferase 1